MQLVKKTNEYQVYKKRSGRHCVKGSDSKWINGDAKIKILVAEKLIKAPKAKAPEPTEEQGDEAAAES